MTTGRNSDARLNFFRHSLILAFKYDFQHHIDRKTPSAAIYGRAGCITFHYIQFGLGIPFTITNTSSMNV
jgi:hypothetical protein